MASFTFKLNPVLNQRVRVMRSCQQKVAVLERSRIEIEDRIRRCHEQIENERKLLREQLTGGADIPKARLQAHATVFLAHQADKLVLELAGVYAQLDTARQELANASSRKRAIELLQEREYYEWRRGELRKEQSEQDDITSIRFGRA